MTTWYPPNNAPPFGSSGESASTPAASAITGTSLTDIGPDLTIPANTAAAGVTYAYEAFLSLTSPGTASDVTTTMAAYLGGIAGTSLVSIQLLNAAGGLTQGSWFIELTGYVRFTSATACQAWIRADGALAASGNGFDELGAAGYYATTGLTTTASQVLTLGWTFSATTGTPSVTPQFAVAYRIA